MKTTTSFLPLVLAITGLALPAMAQDQTPAPAPPSDAPAKSNTPPLADILSKLANDESLRKLLGNVDVEKLMNDENVQKALKDVNVGEVLKNVDVEKLIIEGDKLLGQMKADAAAVPNHDGADNKPEENPRHQHGIRNPQMRMFMLRQPGDAKPDDKVMPKMPELQEFGKIMRGAVNDTGWHIGVACAPVNAMLREHLDLPKDSGLIVTEVLGDSPAAKAGIRKNDIVVSANQQMTGTQQALIEAVQKAGTDGKPLVMEIIHHGKRGTVTVQPQGPPQPKASSENAAPHAMPGVFAEQARQIQELRNTVNQQQHAIEQMREQIAELHHAQNPPPTDHQ